MKFLWFSMFENLNYVSGQLIADHPYKHIITSLIATFIFSLGLINLDLENDIRASFSPPNSRAAYENQVYKEFYNLTAQPQRAFILFSAKDNASILREKELDDVNKLDEYFNLFLGKIDPKTGVPGCHPLCDLNKPFQIISDELMKMYKSENKTPSSDLILDYPMSIYKGQNVFVGMNMIGAKTSDQIFPGNNSKIISLQTVILWYFSRADTANTRDVLKEISMKLFKESQKNNYLDSVKFEIFGDEIANREMVRGAIEATTLMSVGFALLVVFVFVSLYKKLNRLRTCAIPLVVFVSVICPFLASLAAFGILTWLGNKTYTIMCVTPFLVLGVGVDDAFIMLESWMKNEKFGNRKERLSAVLVNIGPSITITSLTNTVAFGIGYATPTPQMSLFCFCTSVALFFDYLLTYSILAPIIYLITPPSESELEEDKETSVKKEGQFFTFASQIPEKIPYFISRYTKFICNKGGRLTALLIMVVLYTVSYTGVAMMKSTFEPSKAFPSDSPLANSMNLTRTVFNEFFPINIIVNNAPKIENPYERKMFYQMVEELESMPESYGKDRTLLWLRNFEEIDQKASDLLSMIGFSSSKYYPSYENLEFFLDKIGYPPHIKYSNRNGTTSVEAFQFTIIAKDMAEWSNRAIMEEKCRCILKKYSEKYKNNKNQVFRYPMFNATLFDLDSPILDLLLTVKTDLIGSITVTVVCMTVICSFFIYNQVGVAIIAFVITSICFSLVGLISWWGADLDPVTMVDVLLATGFSVDYTAHVAHQYYVKSGSPEQRIAESLNEMFTPMLQAGISTILCMLPLIFISTYAIVAFAKTVFVVVGIGLLHGLFLLPVLLVLLPQQILCLGSCVSEKEPLSVSTTSTTLIIPSSSSSEPFLH